MSEIMDEERKHEPQIPRTMAEKAAAWEAMVSHDSETMGTDPTGYAAIILSVLERAGVDYRARLEPPEGYRVDRYLLPPHKYCWGFVSGDDCVAKHDWGKAEAIEAAWQHYEELEAAEADEPEQVLHPRCNRLMQEATMKAQRLANDTGVPARVPWLRSDGEVRYAFARPSIPSHMDAAEREWDEPCPECNGKPYQPLAFSVWECPRCVGGGK